jgi:hypothetical protein
MPFGTEIRSANDPRQFADVAGGRRYSYQVGEALDFPGRIRHQIFVAQHVQVVAGGGAPEHFVLDPRRVRMADTVFCSPRAVSRVSRSWVASFSTRAASLAWSLLSPA